MAIKKFVPDDKFKYRNIFEPIQNFITNKIVKNNIVLATDDYGETTAYQLIHEQYDIHYIYLKEVEEAIFVAETKHIGKKYQAIRELVKFFISIGFSMPQTGRGTNIIRDEEEMILGGHDDDDDDDEIFDDIKKYPELREKYIAYETNPDINMIDDFLRHTSLRMHWDIIKNISSIHEYRYYFDDDNDYYNGSYGMVFYEQARLPELVIENTQQSVMEYGCRYYKKLNDDVFLNPKLIESRLFESIDIIFNSLIEFINGNT